MTAPNDGWTADHRLIFNGREMGRVYQVERGEDAGMWMPHFMGLSIGLVRTIDKAKGAVLQWLTECTAALTPAIIEANRGRVEREYLERALGRAWISAESDYKNCTLRQYLEAAITGGAKWSTESR